MTNVLHVHEYQDHASISTILGMRIPMRKKVAWGSVIFIIGMLIVVRRHLYIETGPWIQNAAVPYTMKYPTTIHPVIQPFIQLIYANPVDPLRVLLDYDDWQTLWTHILDRIYFFWVWTKYTRMIYLWQASLRSYGAQLLPHKGLLICHWHLIKWKPSIAYNELAHTAR